MLSKEVLLNLVCTIEQVDIIDIYALIWGGLLN